MRNVGPKAAQCRENCRALFLHYDLLPPKLIATAADRTYFQLNDQFMHDFLRLVPSRFSSWDFVKHHVIDPDLFKKHQIIAMGDPVGFGDLSYKTTAKRGWRENVTFFSMQLIEHETGVLEADYDIGNPNIKEGLAGIFVHGFEVLHNRILNRKTNPFRVMKSLRKRKIDVQDIRKEKG